LTLGWRGLLSSSGSGGASSQTIAFTYEDIFYAIGIANASYTTASSTLTSPFSSVRVKEIEVWELNGNSVSLTLAQSQIATTFVSGADRTVSDIGTSAYPSYVSIVPKVGSISANWFSGANNTNLFIVNDMIDIINLTGHSALNLAVRVHINYTLNDADASTQVYTTAGTNTVVAGLMYWRSINFATSNHLVPDPFPSIGTYNA